MWKGALGIQAFAAALLLVQILLLMNLFRRMYYYRLYTHKNKPEILAQRLVNAARRSFVIIIICQLVRIVDPFIALGIWPYWVTRVTGTNVTAFLFFQWCVICYNFFDTSYRCTLKPTPSWLLWISLPLTLFNTFQMNAMIALEWRYEEGWTVAAPIICCAAIILATLVGFNVSGVRLWQVLSAQRALSQTLDANFGRSSKSAADGPKERDALKEVSTKTCRSLFVLNLGAGAVALFFITGAVKQLNRLPAPVLSADVTPPPVYIVSLFAQLFFTFIFIWLLWIDKKVLAARASETASQTSMEEKPGSRQSSGGSGSNKSGSVPHPKQGLMVPRDSFKTKRSSWSGREQSATPGGTPSHSPAADAVIIPTFDPPPLSLALDPSEGVSHSVAATIPCFVVVVQGPEETPQANAENWTVASSSNEASTEPL